MADQTRPALPPITMPLLVGRESELVTLRDALAAAVAGRGSLVLIGGEAGIGKTALAEALCDEAVGRDALVLVGRCYDLSETPPYGPWREALAGAPCDDALPLLPTAVLPPDHGGDALGSQAAIFARVLAYLTALAAARPLVLLLDDLHWADPVSLDLLRFLGRHLAGVPLLVLVTYRADEVTRRHPLYALLPVLVREARAARLDPRPLVEADLRGVAARYALSPGDEARLVAYLHQRAEGNPFYAGELLRALEEARALHRAGRGWCLDDLAGALVPMLLRQVLDARVARLGVEAERLLAVAAVIGQAVPLGLWAAVAAVTEESLLEVIERAVEIHILTATADEVRFVHALIREALYEGILPPRRRGWHRRVAELLLAAPNPDPDAVAHHLRQAGDPRAGAWLVRAGERAQRAYAWLTAAARFEAALAVTGMATGQERGWLLVGLANLYRYADIRQSLGYLDEAMLLAADADDRLLLASARFYAGQFRGYAGEIRRGVADIEAAVAELSPLLATGRPPVGVPPPLRVPPTLAGCQGTLAVWLAFSGRHVEARGLAELAMAHVSSDVGAGEVIQAQVDSALVANAWTALAFAEAASGRPVEARRAFAQSRERFHAYDHRVMVGWTASQELCWAVLPYQAERVAERRALAAEAEEAWSRGGGAQVQQLAHLVPLPLLLIEGRWAEALERLHAATPQGAHATHFLPTVIALARARGDSATAWALVRATLPEDPSSTPGDRMFLPATAIQRLAALLALDDGDVGTARAWLGAHDRWLGESGARLGQAEGHLAWARYHRAAGDAARARWHADAGLHEAITPRQPLALLVAHRLLGELDTAAGHCADAQAHLDAALALAESCAAPYERALTLLALAELRAVERQGEEFRSLLDAARAICGPLDAKPALAHADALETQRTGPSSPQRGYPAGLTARVVEVLRLVAQGLPNAEVAARLFLSGRTIEQHLRSAYSKLGVSSRTAATRFVIEQRL